MNVVGVLIWVRWFVVMKPTVFGARMRAPSRTPRFRSIWARRA